MTNWLSSIFKKEKLLSHAEYDAQWKKLTRKEKSIGLSEVYQYRRREKERKEYEVIKRKAEEGKQVGKECTCIPGYKQFINQYCSYCQWKIREDYYNTPG